MDMEVIQEFSENQSYLNALQTANMDHKVRLSYLLLLRTFFSISFFFFHPSSVNQLACTNYVFLFVSMHCRFPFFSSPYPFLYLFIFPLLFIYLFVIYFYFIYFQFSFFPTIDCPHPPRCG